MEKTILEFESKKEKLINLLKELQEFLLKGKELDIEIDEKMIKKIEW